LPGSEESKDWDDLSDWYDEKQGETGDLGDKAFIDSVLLRLIGSCQGKDVLDLGCGNGYLARRLARDGARVTGVDSSLRMLENAKAHDPKDSLKVEYIHSDAKRLAGVADASFDMVYASMSLMDIEEAEAAIGEVSRVLRGGGKFVASISHPCFDNGSNSGWIVQKAGPGPIRVYRGIRAYRSPFSENMPWKVENNETRYTRSFHRPLNWYARVLHAKGFAITALEEPEPTEEFLEEEKQKGSLQSLGFLEVPLHLVIEAIKL
jgi:ubiquinone/menaquinone biosynthesis C-methylase UbiE